MHPDLYHRVKIFGSDPVQDIFSGIPDLGPGPEQSILDEAYDSLGRLGPGRLVNATHRRGRVGAELYARQAALRDP